MIVFGPFGSPQHIPLVSCERAEDSTRRQPVRSRKQLEVDLPASSPPIKSFEYDGTLIKDASDAYGAVERLSLRIFDVTWSR
jgi:hypothetical protein